MNLGSAFVSAYQHWRFLHLPLDIRKCDNSRLPIFSRASSLIISKLEEQHILPIRNKEKPIEIFRLVPEQGKIFLSVKWKLEDGLCKHSHPPKGHKLISI
jgi:hypothetical protein